MTGGWGLSPSAPICRPAGAIAAWEPTALAAAIRGPNCGASSRSTHRLSQRPPNAGFRNTSRSRTDMLVRNPYHPQALNEFCQNAAAVGRNHGHLGLEYFGITSVYGSLRSACHSLPI